MAVYVTDRYDKVLYGSIYNYNDMYRLRTRLPMKCVRRDVPNLRHGEITRGHVDLRHLKLIIGIL